MSAVKGKVGSWELEWASPPRGASGAAFVRVSGELVEVRWRRDGDGLWIELADGVFGYDLDGQIDDGVLRYRITERGSDRAWEDVGYLRAGEEHLTASEGGRKKAVRVRAQMPGKIVRVLAKAGAAIDKDQPLLVMEAMKMENEIRAPQAGQVKDVKVTEGQAVETGADLVILD